MGMKRTWGGWFGAGLLGIVVAGGCGHSDTQVGSVNGPVAGGACGTAGTTLPAGDGCNTCTCGSNGHWACTLEACGGCTKGDSKPAGDGCNTCTCQADGSWACTLLGCVDCTPGTTKPAGDGCNTCSCTDTGTWACTEKACSACNPGDTKPSDDGCNTCACSAGGQWLCTLRACASPDAGQCPAARPAAPGTACLAVVTWAKDPVTGSCCQYGDPCSTPEAWMTYNTSDECSAAAACPPPATPDPGVSCPAIVAYAKDPSSGVCCTYGDPCRAPKGWKVYHDAASCSAGQ